MQIHGEKAGMKITYAVTALTCITTIALTPLILKVYSVKSPEALALGLILITIHNGCAIVLWPAAFSLPNILRAANDVRYPMLCSIASMVLIRLAAGYLLAVHFGMGAIRHLDRHGGRLDVSRDLLRRTPDQRKMAVIRSGTARGGKPKNVMQNTLRKSVSTGRGGCFFVLLSFSFRPAF
ncbi:MAG: hypothetical protein ACLR4Z_02230 [Butyricicoccaceae bacterium]